MKKEKEWLEQKQHILDNMDKINGKVTVSKLQEKFSLSFVRAKEVYDDYSYKIKKDRLTTDYIKKHIKSLYKIKISALMKVNPDYCYLDKKLELLANDYELICKTNNEVRVSLAIDIKNYLEEMNIPFYVMGNLTSSYFAYLFDVHNVDTLKYNIKPEMCYGIESEPIAFPLDFHIPKGYEIKAFDILSDAFVEDYVYNVCYQDENTNNYVLIDNQYAFASDDNIKEKIISISIDGKEYKCLLSEDVWKNEEIVEINMICDIDPNEYNSKITFVDIDRNLEEIKIKLVNAIDYSSEYSDDIKKNIADSIHSSYDLVLWFGLLHSSYYNRKVPSRIDELREIVFRDDIFNYLLASGVEKEKAYHIATKIRKGRYVDVVKMLEEEYINSDECKKYQNIMYAFPKGHGLAAVLNIARKILK